MKTKKRDDGLVDLIDDDGNVVAIGSEEAIKAMMNDPLQMQLLETGQSVRLPSS